MVSPLVFIFYMNVSVIFNLKKGSRAEPAFLSVVLLLKIKSLQLHKYSMIEEMYLLRTNEICYNKFS